MAESLNENEPCPVCGSTNHPCIAQKSDTAPSENELDEMKQRADMADNECRKIADKMCIRDRVTKGGVITDDFNPNTMESKLVNGLYATGEVLDIDGDCGGYNLQWAWSSGYLAGISVGK